MEPSLPTPAALPLTRPRAHAVVCNRDLPLAYPLLDGPARDYGQAQGERLAGWDYSAGVIAFNWSVNKRLDALLHHNVFLSGGPTHTHHPCSHPCGHPCSQPRSAMHPATGSACPVPHAVHAGGCMLGPPAVLLCSGVSRVVAARH